MTKLIRSCLERGSYDVGEEGDSLTQSFGADAASFLQQVAIEATAVQPKKTFGRELCS